MTDPRVMPEEERRILSDRLYKIHPILSKDLEEESIDRYDTTIARLKAAKNEEFAQNLERKILNSAWI